jgi:hypothetical protein
MKRSVFWIQSIWGELDADRFREQFDQAMRGRVVEVDGAAYDMCRRAPSAMPEDLVTLAYELAREIEQPRSGNAGLARQPVTLAVGHEREIAGLQQTRFGSLDLEPAPARCDDVEHQTVLHRRQLQRPRRGELRVTIEDSAHPQEVQRFAERVHRGPWIVHAGEYAARDS